MSIPDYQTVMLPLLKLVAKHGQLKMSDATDEFKGKQGQGVKTSFGCL